MFYGGRISQSVTDLILYRNGTMPVTFGGTLAFGEGKGI
jgi:hypothetical protein